LGKVELAIGAIRVLLATFLLVKPFLGYPAKEARDATIQKKTC
jgi:hypothetical protein